MRLNHVGVSAELCGVVWWPAKNLSQEAGDVQRMVGAHMRKDWRKGYVLTDALIKAHSQTVEGVFATYPLI